MRIDKIFNRFLTDEDGAVTVDWVVLTAAIVGLGIAVLGSVTSGTEGVTDNISNYLGSAEVTSAF